MECKHFCVQPSVCLTWPQLLCPPWAVALICVQGEVQFIFYQDVDNWATFSDTVQSSSANFLSALYPLLHANYMFGDSVVGIRKTEHLYIFKNYSISQAESFRTMQLWQFSYLQGYICGSGCLFRFYCSFSLSCKQPFYRTDQYLHMRAAEITAVSENQTKTNNQKAFIQHFTK